MRTDDTSTLTLDPRTSDTDHSQADTERSAPKAPYPPFTYLIVFCTVVATGWTMIQFGEWAANKRTSVTVELAVPATGRTTIMRDTLSRGTDDYVAGVIIKGTTPLNLDYDQFLSPEISSSDWRSTVQLD